MPAFIKTPADEARWEKAKEAANKTLSESDGDSYWKLTNSIYQKMAKAEEFSKGVKDFFESCKKSSDVSSLDDLQTFLEKARKRMSDEIDDSDEDDSDISEDQGFREFDPDEEEDDADRWLAEHDPERNMGEDEDEQASDEDEEYTEEPFGEGEETFDEEEPEEGDFESEEPEAEAPIAAKPTEASPSGGSEQRTQQAQAEEVNRGSERFPQPSKEDIAEMRRYTRPWEQNARDRARLTAEASKNPVLHHEGRLVEARNTAHKDRQSAYAQFQASPEYQNADPITQMELDAKFHKDWHEKNPEHLSNAVKLHGEAHKKGLSAKDLHAAAKDEQIRHVLTGGAQAEAPVSVEEGLQHAGGAKGEEGTTGSIAQDRASSFAAGNKDFINQYAKDYEKKAKKPKDLGDLANYDEGSRADIERVLGDHPALKDPKNKAKVDAFFKQYHPLIGMNAQKVLNKLGLDHTKGDIDLGMLHEAGMHGLMQAINDYDHDHPSQASFSTHAGNKIRGLMQTALRNNDAIPQELRAGAKKFQQANMPKPDIKSMVAKHPPEVADRLKRIDTARQVKPPKPNLKPEGTE